MKRFRVIREPAVGIVALAVLALIAGTLGMWFFQHRAELTELHERLGRDTDEMIRQLQVFNGKLDQNSISDHFIPLDLKQRLLQVEAEQGNLLYRSPDLANPLTGDQRIRSYLDASGSRHRLEIFHTDGLTLYVNADLDPDDNFMHEIGGGLVLAVPAMFVIILIGGLWLRDRALRPVQRVREDIAKITAQSLDQPLQKRAAAEEITELVSTLNVTFQGLHSSFAQTARFSADASHQLKTPLCVLRLGVEELLIDPQIPKQQRVRLEELLDQIHRLTSIVEKLLLLSRADSGRLALQPEKLDVSELLASFLDDVAVLAEGKQITLETELSAPGFILADRDSVAIILENLMENAVKYNHIGGQIKIVASKTDRWTEILIENTANKIPPERAAHIFQRFYRGSGGEDKPGHGLGLSIAQELAESNLGQLALVRSDNQWTTFRLRLPNADPCELSPEQTDALLQ